MKPSLFAGLLSAFGVAALLTVGAAAAADVHVMISAGFYQVYSELAPAFERASSDRLVTTRGPCQRSLIRKAGCSTSISTKASATGKTIVAAT